MARKLATLFAAFAVTLCSSAYALGLGGIESRSALNQPLSARIALHAVQPDELDEVRVNLAPSDAFARAGVDRPFHLSRLRFEVGSQGGAPFIFVTSRDPIKEPFLDFLVEVRWPNGRMVREYTLLLDPPVFAGDERAAPAARPGGVRSAQAAPAEPRGTRAPMQAQPVRGEASAGAAGTGQHTVREGETLWRVANMVRPDSSVSVHQTMLGIVRANPDAFLDGDPNRMKRGAVLRIPDREALTQVSRGAAFREVEALLAANRPSAPAVAETEPAAAPPRRAPEGRLQVVAAGDAEAGDGSPVGGDLDATAANVSRLQQQISLMEESQLNLEAENEDLKGQVTGLKQEVASLERLLNLQMEGVAPAEAQRTPEPSVLPVEPAVAAAEKPAEAEQAADPVKPVATEASPAAKPEAIPTAQRRPATAPAAVVPAEPSLWDDPLPLAAGGAGVLVLALLTLLVVRRRRAAAAAAPVTISFSSDVDADHTHTANAAEPGLAPALQEDQAETGDSGDVLSEVDVYLAYGRYDQAQEALFKALNADPQRHEVRVKLLEIFALTENRAGFEEHAEILHGQIEHSDPLWQRAVEMGRSIAPEHPFFSVEFEEPAAEALDLSSEDLLVGETAAAEPEAATPVEDAGGLDFDLDFTPASEAPAPAEAAPAALEFARAESPTAHEDDAFSLDFELDGPAADATGSTEAAVDDDEYLKAVLNEPHASDLTFEAPQESSAEETISFDLDGEDDSQLLSFESEADHHDSGLLHDYEEGDEVATKLDLARAYLDMGDQEGAQSLLEEVLQEGNDGQKSEAGELLRRAG
jgi:pilus assembly protein FimV